jgi:hypothetical protein
MPRPADRGRGGSVRRRWPATGRDRKPRCSQVCSRDGPRHPGMSEYRMRQRCGVRPACGPGRARGARASTRHGQLIRFRRATAASPPDSCPRGRGHRGPASLFWPSWSRRRHLRTIVVLAGRATDVPEAAVTNGMQRSTTVTPRRPMGWAPVSDLRRGSRAKLHGMQEVRPATGLQRTLRRPHGQATTDGQPWRQ